MKSLIGLKVRCYKNLHKGNWSITLQGKVIAHVSELVLKDVTFVYWKGGYDRVIASAANGKPRRRVCAWAVGTVIAAAPADKRTSITYNPYRSSEFTTRDGKVITYCAAVHFTAGAGAFAIGEVR